MRSKIKEVLNKVKNEELNLIYLVESVDEDCGFFLHENKFLFASKNKDNEKLKEINTNYLSMKTKTHIDVVTNEPTFEAGEYNLLYFNHSIEDERLGLFINLSELYSEIKDKISFVNFFEQMQSLFQSSTEKNKKSLVGILGELYFIIKMFYLGHDLSNSWLTTGKYSKYDFVLEDIKMEVKTTSSTNPIFKIKHDQVFSNGNVYIITVLISEDNSGLSIMELVEKIKEINTFKENFSFMAKLNSILFKMEDDLETKNKKYSLTEINIYDADSLHKIDNIPGNVFNLVYDYNFITEESMEINVFSKILYEAKGKK
jgi:hypothetical protein